MKANGKMDFLMEKGDRWVLIKRFTQDNFLMVLSMEKASSREMVLS